MKGNQIVALVLVVLVVVSAGVFFAINKSNNPINDDPDRNKVPDSDYYPVTISTVPTSGPIEQTFYESPKRIVVMFDSNLELLCYFGLQDRIVGCFNVQFSKTLSSDNQKAFDSVEKIAENFSVERVRSLEPDLIIAWTSTLSGSRLGTIEMWNEFGTNCMITNRPAETVDDYLKVLEDIGKVFNMNGTAAKKIAEFTSIYPDVAKKVAGLTESQKVTALVLEPGYSTGCYGYGAAFLTGDLVTRAGGINLFDGGMRTLTFEQIIKYDPDVVIIVPDFSSPIIQTPEYSIAEFKAIPAFASLSAIKNDRVIGFEFYEIYMGGFLPDDILDRIFEALYPS
jgi:ABC-type Fe3+-hydroxamate transport system, periplasmic component